MKILKFVHGGRCGDFIFALHTIKKICEKGNALADIRLVGHHQVGWSRELAESLIPLAEYQDYVHQCSYEPVTLPSEKQYDFIKAEEHYNPKDFPEWHGKDWPGNINIDKRYAVYFGVEYDPEETWLKAPIVYTPYRVIVQAPFRRCTDISNLAMILKEFYGKSLLIPGNDKSHELLAANSNVLRYNPVDFLDSAALINSADVFLGAVSSCNAIAEGLKKPRFVQVQDDCYNINLDDKTGFNITYWPPMRVVNKIEEFTK